MDNVFKMMYLKLKKNRLLFFNRVFRERSHCKSQSFAWRSRLWSSICAI